MQSFRRHGWLLIVVLFAGCGRSAAPAAVEGEVSYQGEPIAQGAIRFFPADETPGQGAATNIVNGQYALPEDAGLVAGTYRVAITGLRATGRQIARENVGADAGEEVTGTVDEVEQFLPPEYNEQLTLTTTLEAGANKVPFALE